jgi:quercetin dioxygenase-like cupin family protein
MIRDMRKLVLSEAESSAGRSNQSWGNLLWLASSEINNAENVTLGRVTILSGQSNPRHCHENCEEILYLLSGRLEHTVGSDSVRLEPGDTLSISAGVYHNATCIGDEDAEMIVAYSTGVRDFQLEKS